MSNSNLLKQYSLVDKNAKLLMLVVKKWAKDNRVSSAADDCISSYAWMNLVIFYMQSLGMLPNLQCRNLMEEAQFQVDPEHVPAHCVAALDTAYLSCEEVCGVWARPEEFKDIPISVLFYGFVHFYSGHFPRSLYATSIRLGGKPLPKAVFRKSWLCFLGVEDPFETHASHCPHDLGSHASEKGGAEILSLFQRTRLYLEEGFCTTEADDGHPIGQLWVPCEAEPPNKAKSKGPRNGGRANRNRRKGRTNNGKATPNTQKPALKAPNGSRANPRENGNSNNTAGAATEGRRQRPERSGITPKSSGPKTRKNPQGKNVKKSRETLSSNKKPS